MNNGFLVELANASMSLVTNYGQPFIVAGWTIFTPLAIWLLIRTGMHTMTNGADWTLIFRTFLRIFIVAALLKYYASPLPGEGVSWPGLIANLGMWMAGKMNTTVIDQAYKSIGDALAGVPSPALLDFRATAAIWVFKGILWLIQGVMMLVIGFAWPVLGVLRWIGPIFIPFALTDGYNYIFHGWFKSLVQFSAYFPIGTAFCCIYATVWMNLFSGYTPPLSMETMMSALGAFVVITVAIVWGVRQIPALTAGIFSGQAGLHAAPGIGIWR
jgi:hypothetical protein